MTEACIRCIKESELSRTQADIEKIANENKELVKSVADIRDINLEHKYLMQRVTDTQDAMSRANLISQEAQTAGFKALTDNEKDKEAKLEKKKEKEDADAIIDKRDRAKEKRANRWTVIFFGFPCIVGYIGVFIKWLGN